jgi:hypothetical protein
MAVELTWQHVGVGTGQAGWVLGKSVVRLYESSLRIIHPLTSIDAYGSGGWIGRVGWVEVYSNSKEREKELY